MPSPIANASVAVVIGAALSSGFNTAFGAATTKIKTVGAALGTLKAKAGELDGLKAAAAKAGTAADVLSTRFTKQSAAAQRDTAHVADLKAQIVATGDPTGKLAVRLDAAQQRALRTNAALEQTTSDLAKAKDKFTTTTKAADDFATANAHIGAALAKVETAYRRYEDAQEAVRRNEEKLAHYRRHIIEYYELARGLQEFTEAAADRQVELLELRHVIRSENPQQATGEALKHAQEFSRGSIASVPELLKVEAVLSKEGFEADVARMATEAAHKVSSVTKQDAEETARAIGHIYNQASRTMTGAPEAKFQRIADLVTQMQEQFDLSKLGVQGIGDTLAKLLPATEAFHIPLQQVGAVTGVLAQKGLDAGTMSIVLARMAKAEQEIGFSPVYDKKGALDFIATIRAMNGALLTTYGSLDAGKDAIFKAFGSRYGGAQMLALSQSTATLFKEQEKMAKEMPGVVDREYKELMGTLGAKLERFKNQLKETFVELGHGMLPILTRVMDAGGALLGLVAEFVHEHNALTAVVGTAVVAFSGLAIAIFAVGYGFTFIRGGWLGAIALLRRLEVELVAARTGFLGLAAAEAAEGETAAASGIGGAIGRSLGGLRGAGGATTGIFTRIFGGIGSAAIALFRPSFWMRLFSGAAGAARVAGRGVITALAATGPAIAGGLGAAGRGITAIPGLLSRASWGLAGGLRGLVTLAWLPGLITGLQTAAAAVGAFFAGVSAPIWIGVALVVAAALLIYHYWKPIGAFFKGFWDGLKQGLAPIGEAFRAAFEPIAVALKPAWDMLKGFFHWLMKSTGMTDEQFKAAFSSGIWWGQKLGAALALSFTVVFSAIGAVIMSLITVGKLLYHLATFNWHAMGEDAKTWGSYMADAGKNIGKAFSNAFTAPDYSGANQKQSAEVKPEAPKPIGESTERFAANMATHQGGTLATEKNKKTLLGHLAPMPKAAVGSSHALSGIHMGGLRKMAAGGLLTKESLVIAGEAGREAVIPLQRPSAMLAIGAALAGALLAVAPARPEHSPHMATISALTIRRDTAPPASPVSSAITQMERERADRPEAREPSTTTNNFSPTINVTAAPGADARAIGSIVERKLYQIYEARDARRRGGNHD